jgi:hypothetical protein
VFGDPAESFIVRVPFELDDPTVIIGLAFERIIGLAFENVFVLLNVFAWLR